MLFRPLASRATPYYRSVVPFVKLDTGMLDSTIWVDREARELFITALLMAQPGELLEPEPQIAVDSLKETGWVVQPGWYGFVPAAGPGIIRRCGMDEAVGMAALERLGNPEPGSRSQKHDGRRMVRIDGGYLILNYMDYRDRDYTAAARSRRYRERKKARRHGVSPGNHGVASRNVTQAEAYAEAEAVTTSEAKPRGKRVNPSWSAKVIDTWNQYGGSAPVGPLVAATKPVYDALQDVDRLCYGLAKWLVAGNAKYGPAAFARDWRSWVPDGKPTSPSKTDIAIAEWLAKHG